MGSKTELSAAKAAKLGAKALTAALLNLSRGTLSEEERAEREEENSWRDGDHDLAEFDELHGKVGEFTLKNVEAIGGGEGGGETVKRVMEVVHPEWAEPKYLSYGGYYESDNGTSFDEDVEFVFPRQVMVTQYFTKAEATKLDKKVAA